MIFPFNPAAVPELALEIWDNASYNLETYSADKQDRLLEKSDNNEPQPCKSKDTPALFISCPVAPTPAVEPLGDEVNQRKSLQTTLLDKTTSRYNT